MIRCDLSVLYAALAILLGCSCGGSEGGPGGRLVDGEGPKSACNSSGDCDAKRPVCDVGVLRCVECAGDDACGPGRPACDYLEGACRECIDDRYCSGGTPLCDTLEQKCVPLCKTDGDCRNKELPRCNVETGRCFACEVDSECQDKKARICDRLGVCVECGADQDCGSKRFCAPPHGKCEECRSGSDCGPDKPYCFDFHCRQCLSNFDCPADAPRCGDDAKCKACDCDRDFGDCSTGQCVCRAGLTACGPTCADLNNDPRHCGECGRKCDDDSICVGAGCVCRPGLVECDGKCIDPGTDPAHCGQCGQACEARCAGGLCTANTCESQAAVGCGERDAACVAQAKIPDHPLHCGECDSRCRENQLCVGGDCHDYAPGRVCDRCPCDDCGSRQCCPHPLASGLVFCVAADRCPGSI